MKKNELLEIGYIKSKIMGFTPYFKLGDEIFKMECEISEYKAKKQARRLASLFKKIAV
jgi:hypothetical protein